MSNKDQEQLRQRVQKIKILLLFSLMFLVLGGYYGFRSSAGILVDSGASLRLVARLSLGLASGLGAALLFALFFTIGDIIFRVRRRLNERLGGPIDGESEAP